MFTHVAQMAATPLWWNSVCLATGHASTQKRGLAATSRSDETFLWGEPRRTQMKTRWVMAAAALVLGTAGSQAQVMSNKTTNNPSTSGYASSATASKDQMSSYTRTASHKRTRTARAAPPAGTSPAETAGASAPNGPCPVNQRDRGGTAGGLPSTTGSLIKKGYLT